MSNPHIDWWSLPDEVLRSQCDEDRFRASGPGGQHRNKTDSGIRLRHRPTGLVAMATERRSQHENRSRAIERLREVLAFQWRQAPLPHPPAEFLPFLDATRPVLSTRHRLFLPLAAYLLDWVEASEGQVSTAADRLGISTARLVKQLAASDEAWQALNQLRAHHGLPTLKQ